MPETMGRAWGEVSGQFEGERCEVVVGTQYENIPLTVTAIVNDVDIVVL